MATATRATNAPLEQYLATVLTLNVVHEMCPTLLRAMELQLPAPGHGKHF